MSVSAGAYNELFLAVEDWVEKHRLGPTDVAEALREMADDNDFDHDKEDDDEMSTNDVPGANPANRDELAMGCWAEHKDGSLIFVESNEADRVIYSIFDMAKTPPVEYRDAMPEESFKKTFSWQSGSKDRWTWHDKTPFPWDRVIKNGFSDGERAVSADDTITAAERVAESLRLRGARIAADRYKHRVEDVRPGQDVAQVIMDKLSRAFGELMK